MAKYKVVHIALQEDPLTIEREQLKGIDCEVVSVACHSQGEIIEAVKEADVVLNTNLPMYRPVIEQMTRGKQIIRYGHGYDTVDVEAATEKGIIVTNIAGVCSEEVSNHALMFLLACSRKLVLLDRRLRQGEWGRPKLTGGIGTIYDQTLGLVAFGNIARALARKAKALGMRVIAYDPYVYPWIAREYGVTLVSFEQLLKESDFISIHCPLYDETRHLFNEKTLRAMKKTAYIINTARGPVIDEQALIKALQQGWIAGAALDVFEQEPTPPDNPLLKMENVIVTPHSAGASDAVNHDVRVRVGQEAARVLRGQRPQVVVNPEVMSKVKLGV